MNISKLMPIQILTVAVTLLSAGPTFGADLQAWPSAPTDPQHPGSKIYSYDVEEMAITCSGRTVNVFLPKARSQDTVERFPVVIYGHGQALSLKNYRATFEHLAGKGVATVFPAYDKGFFDQDWKRMGEDYVTLSDCALKQLTSKVDVEQVVFSGHSKGAYVASMASGIAFAKALSLRPKAIVLYEAAGADASTVAAIASSTALTVVYGEADTVVSRQISETIYKSSGSALRQFIFVKSYSDSNQTTLKADHFFPLTAGSAFGGGEESALHYYGAWKWLTAAALDLKQATPFTHPDLYGSKAGDKGVSSVSDEIKRNW